MTEILWDSVTSILMNNTCPLRAYQELTFYEELVIGISRLKPVGERRTININKAQSLLF